jgi:hypothetical protein
MFEKICIGVLTASALVLAISAVTTDSDGSEATVLETQVGDLAPPLSVVGADGATSEIDMSGRTLAVFFSTECPWCIQSLSIYRQVAESDCELQVVLAVTNLGPAELADWMSGEQIGSHQACDVIVGAVSRPYPYEVRGTPTHYLVSQGRVVEKGEGAMLELPAWFDGAG